MKISDYLPNLYNNNLEMNNIIITEEYELENNLKPSIDNSFLYIFISTANEKGISQYEELFGIKPNPAIETLEFRKERVISRLISKIPFSERYFGKLV